MKRRDFVLLLAGAMTAARSLGAQQKAVRVIGYFSSGWSPGWGGSLEDAFLQGLGETGYVEGQNVAIEYRLAEGSYDRLPAMAADLVGRKVEVIVAGGPPRCKRRRAQLRRSRSSSPVSGDPVGTGLVASLARPGGNVTGISEMTTDLMPKRLELLSELVPQGYGHCPAREPDQCECQALSAGSAGSGADKGGAAPYPDGQ